MARKKNIQTDDYNLPRLCKAMEASLESLQKFREERMEVVRRAAGNHYGDLGGRESGEEKRFINWMSQYRTVVSRQLVPKNPRCLISSFAPKAKAICDTLETWANQHFENIYLGETLLRIAYDALDCIGIAMVALADPADAESTGYETPVGEPFIKRIDIEDFVYDHRAKCFRECSFMGHHFRCTVETANALYIKGKEEKFEAMPPRDMNPQGDDRIGIFGHGKHVEDDEYEEYVSLWLVYLPKKNVLLTLRCGEDGMPECDEEPLRVQRWVGPPCGPYHFFAPIPVPGSAMPKAPTWDLMDLDELVNLTVRKLADQAGNQKTFVASSGSSNDDGERARTVQDGDVLDFDDPSSIQEVRVGGPDQVNFAFAIKSLDWLNRQSGNLETMAGLTQSAGTAKQEELLNTNASKTIMDLMDASLTFTESVMKAYIWLHYHHPYQDIKAPYQTKGYKQASIMRSVSPMERYQVDWNDLMLKVDPYAKPHQTPQQKIAFINSVMGAMAPREQMLMAQGIMFESQNYLDLMAKLGDCEELRDMYGIRQQMMMGAGGTGAPAPEGGDTGYGGAGGGSSNPTEASSQGQDAALIQKLMGGNAGGNPNASPSMMAVG